MKQLCIFDMQVLQVKYCFSALCKHFDCVALFSFGSCYLILTSFFLLYNTQAMYNGLLQVLF